jgi:hypothetical protein
MKQLSLWSSVIVCLLFVSPMFALAQGDGVIQGQVVNGTPGGSPGEGLEITLRAFQGQSEAEPLVSTVDSGGRFRFEGLQVGSDWRYMTQVSHQGVVYSKGPLVFDSGESEIATETSIYESTNEDEGIVVERAHVLVDAEGSQLGQPGSVLVTEVHVFLNPGDRTFTGSEEVQGQRASTRFVLPKDSYDWAFEDGSLGGRFLATDGGFLDREPLWPGTTSVMFSYALDCRAGDCNLDRDVTHPISNLNLLIADTGVRVESDRLDFAGQVDAEGQDYLNYVGLDLMPGERLDLTVRLPTAGPARVASSRGSSSTLPWIILGGVLTALALAYPFWLQHVRASVQPKGGD